MAEYTRSESLQLAKDYLSEAVSLHTKEKNIYGNSESERLREREANSIELAKAFMMLHDRLIDPGPEY